MYQIICPICKQGYNYNELTIVRSQNCGHGICLSCLNEKYNLSINHHGSIIWSSQCEKIKCPICDEECNRNVWVTWHSEYMMVEKEDLIRTKVNQLLYADRESFQTTPEYHEFLEDKEDLIYRLIEEKNQRKNAEYVRELDHKAIKYQQRTLEATERKKIKKKNNLLRIVDEEGIFYESIIHSHNFTYSVDPSQLHHPLKIQYPEIFNQISNSDSCNDDMNNLEGKKNEADLLTYLKANLPQVIENKRKVGNINQRSIAGGLNKKMIALRTQQEAWAFRI